MIVAITWIFLVGDVLMTGRLIFIGAAAVYDRRAREDLRQAGGDRVLQAESCGADSRVQRRESHRATVRAALNSNYPNLRVIVIDDGSKDRTLEVARNAFRSRRPLRESV